jgi:hypothetical protein
LFGVAEESGEVLQADVGVTQVVLRGLAADVVDEGGEAGVFCGEAPLQCPWVQAELLGLPPNREEGQRGFLTDDTDGRIPVPSELPSDPRYVL